MLIAARFVQGVGAAMSTSVILALILTEFPEPAERAKAMSVYMFVAVAGASVGLLVGGALTDALDWHWIFLVNLPIGLAVTALGIALIDEPEATRDRQAIDVLGSVLVTGALMLGVYAIVTAAPEGWASAHTLGFGGAALALLAAFGLLETRVANPLVPPRILAVRSLTGSSVVRALLVSGIWSTFFLAPQALARVHGYAPLEVGLALLPMTLGLGALSFGPTAKLVGRFGPRRVLAAGVAASIAGLLLLAGGDADSAYAPGMLAGFLVVGIGRGWRSCRCS